MIYALHGAVGMAADWREFAKSMKALDEHGVSEDLRRVARVDLWQYLACCPMPIGEFGSAFNKEVAAENPVLLGYSMGGRLALHALLDEPGKWQMAVIVSAHTGIPSEDRIKRRAADAAWAAKALKGDWAIFLDEWNGQSVLGTVGSSDLADRHKLKPRRESVARSFMDWSVGMQDDLLPQLHKITCPVLWLVGEHDEKFLKVAERAVEELAHGKLCIIPDCGHRVPWEQPEAFQAAVKEFLVKAKSE